MPLRKNSIVILLAAAVIALPFIFRRDRVATDWKPGDPMLVIISPHNEAIRYEFEIAFSAWHHEQFGHPVKIDWRSIGGTTEIMRYLEAECMAAFRAWRRASHKPWPSGADRLALDRRFNPAAPPTDASATWEIQKDLHGDFRNTDDPLAFGAGIDLFFGGGAYDHAIAAGQGLTVPPWAPKQRPEALFTTPTGVELLPVQAGGEVWRSDTFYGTALSTFGICSNPDRLRDLGITNTPVAWSDLADPRYAGQIGVADPTKSGSIAKAFEMIIHEQCLRAVEKAGFTPAQCAANESRIQAARQPPGIMPPEVPDTYQQAIEEGWEAGLRLVQGISANSRYFTDSAGKVPVDVSTGDAAAGIAIDFFGRYQAESTRSSGGEPRMRYVTPIGGSSASADPISLLRGAPHRELAVRFIVFTLSPEGQRLWTYRAGTPGGPRKFSLRRLPMRRDFYPDPEHPAQDAVHRGHLRFSSDPLDAPAVNPYALAERFTYHPRWTGAHFNIHRDLIRTMGMDAGDELKTVWKAIHQDPDPSRRARAIALLGRLPDQPEPLTWESALTMPGRYKRLDLMREWTLFYRRSYREALQSLDTPAPSPVAR
jgi:iron(III) transport system substrate-binding protein